MAIYGKDMTFGMFMLNSVPPWKTAHQELKDELEQIVLGDELGFHSAWVAEHNARVYGVVSSAPVYLAAAAAKTKQIKLGTAVVRLPLYNPLKLAEDLALVDVVSDGRLYVGVGKGYDDLEFAAYNEDYSQRDEKYLESLKVLKNAFQNDRVTHKGKYYDIQDVPTYPRPVQQPTPPFFVMISSSDSSVVKAAEQGHSIILGQFPDWNNTRHKIDLYRKTALAAGYSEEYVNEAIARSGKLFNFYVAEDTQQAIDEYEKGLMWYMDTRDNRGMFGFSYERQSYEYFLNHKSVIVGSPEKVTADIKQFREETGLNHMICWFNCGGQPQDKVLHSMRLFAKEVMPHFENSMTV